MAVKCMTPAVRAIAMIVSAVSMLARQPADWSGTWISPGPENFQVLRNVHQTAHGWDSFVESMQQTRGYTIVVIQNASEITVTFPGGGRNLLSEPAYAFADEPRSAVENRGDYWINHVTSARRVGESIELSSTTFSGWWKNGDPAAAKAKPTDFRSRLTLAPGARENQLVLHATLSDEKGEVEYRQTFTRQP